MSNADRTERLHILLSPDEDQRLKALAGHQGLSVSDYLRQQIRDAWGRCARCGAEMKMRVFTGERKPWSLTADGLNVCGDCAPHMTNFSTILGSRLWRDTMEILRGLQAESSITPNLGNPKGYPSWPAFVDVLVASDAGDRRRLLLVACIALDHALFVARGSEREALLRAHTRTYLLLEEVKAG